MKANWITWKLSLKYAPKCAIEISQWNILLKYPTEIAKWNIQGKYPSEIIPLKYLNEIHASEICHQKYTTKICHFNMSVQCTSYWNING